MVLDSAFVEKCRQAFQALDTGHQGALDRVEMRDLLESKGRQKVRIVADVIYHCYHA